MNPNSKVIEALDEVIAAYTTLKEAFEAMAGKSGDSADDESTAEVSGRKRAAKTAAVPAAGKKPTAKKSRTADDEDTDGDAADTSDLPPPKGLKAKKTKKEEVEFGENEEPSRDDVKAIMIALIEKDGDKNRAVAILKRHKVEYTKDLKDKDLKKVYDAALEAVNGAEAEDVSEEEDI